jgi:NMD protein affecting ribosome stability and mRNA decay
MLRSRATRVRDGSPGRSEKVVMSKGLIRSLNRRGSQSDKTPPVARKQTFSDPSICNRCGAVYTGKTWRRGRRLTSETVGSAKWVTCPGCAQAAAGEYHGQVLIEVNNDEYRDPIIARINNVERRAQATQPERQIVSISWTGKTLEVLTTSQKLAHRVAHEVEKAFGGVVHYSWADDDGTLLAKVTIAAKAGGPGKSR